MPDTFSQLVLATNSMVDYVVIFAFIAYGIVYFLAPVLGYATERRGILLLSLYALLAYSVVVLLQVIIAYILYLSGAAERGGSMNIAYLLAILKLILFLASMATFTFGLQSLKRNHA